MIPWPMWILMGGNEQSKIVAAYKTDQKIHAVDEQDEKRRSFLQRLLGRGKKGK